MDSCSVSLALLWGLLLLRPHAEDMTREYLYTNYTCVMKIYLQGIFTVKPHSLIRMHVVVLV